MNCERLGEASFSQWRKDLIDAKGSDVQRAFLALLTDSRGFCWSLEDRVGVEAGERLPLLRMELSEGLYKKPSKDLEREIFEIWRDLPVEQARSPGLWGLLYLRHIQAGSVESHFLAASRSVHLPGKTRIVRALDRAEAKEIDGIVRDALRHLCGLPEVRGSRSVYVDCVFGRAWWRGYLCEKVCGHTGADPGEVAEVFRASQGYWERLVAWALTRNLPLGDANVHNALIWALSEYAGRERRLHLFAVTTLSEILRRIDMRCRSEDLRAVPLPKLKRMMEKEFFAVVR